MPVIPYAGDINKACKMTGEAFRLAFVKKNRKAYDLFEPVQCLNMPAACSMPDLWQKK